MAIWKTAVGLNKCGRFTHQHDHCPNDTANCYSITYIATVVHTNHNSNRNATANGYSIAVANAVTLSYAIANGRTNGCR